MILNLAAIILFDNQKKILLQYKEESPRLGRWAFFGGKIEGDETPEEAVKRETYEELHYKLKNPKLVMVQKFKDKHHDRTMYVFIERYDPTKKLVLGEGEGMKWLKLSEAEKLNIVEQDKEVLRYIKDKY